MLFAKLSTLMGNFPWRTVELSVDSHPFWMDDDLMLGLASHDHQQNLLWCSTIPTWIIVAYTGPQFSWWILILACEPPFCGWRQWNRSSRLFFGEVSSSQTGRTPFVNKKLFSFQNDVRTPRLNEVGISRAAFSHANPIRYWNGERGRNTTAITWSTKSIIANMII